MYWYVIKYIIYNISFIKNNILKDLSKILKIYYIYIKYNIIIYLDTSFPKSIFVPHQICTEYIKHSDKHV